MKPEAYTFFVASNRKGTFRKMVIPVYALQLLGILVLVGGITVAAAVGSYTRMLLKVGNYNTLRRQQDTMKHNYEQLQSSVQDANQRLDSLQSLATEVAMTYGFMQFRQSPFRLSQTVATESDPFQQSVAQFNFLEKNVSAAAFPVDSLRLLPVVGLGDQDNRPSIWPVMGHLTGYFGERLDPFNGEGAFHSGVDISSQYGDPIRVTADGVVTEAGEESGYGRVVIVDHGYGVTTLYGHLSSFNVVPGEHLTRGDVIGNVGVSGRSTGPHVHYEVRINSAPVNPMRYLHRDDSAD